MKRLSLLALVVVVSAGLAGSITETFEYTSGMLQHGSQDGYATVTLPVAPHCEPLGAPDLPTVTHQVVIPPTAEVTGFEILEIEEQSVPGSYDILPVQYPVPWAIDYEKQPFVEPDPAYYGVDAVYPAEAALMGTVGNKAGYRLVNFGIHPVRYNPVTKQLTLVKRIRVRVEYETHRRHVARRTEVQNMIHGSWVSRLVLNTGDVDRFAPPVRRASRSSSFLPAGDFEHVIITTSPWVDSLQPLVDWRTRQGWRSTIMLESDITSTYPGRDTPEKIRNFIKDADTTWGTIYVFIARPDYPVHDDVRITNSYSSYMTKCDMYYSDLDRDWDGDGDNIFGEVTDSVDGYADVYVGMITITDGAELSNYIRKIFAYELSPDTTTEWVTKQILPNGVTFSNEYNDSCAVASASPPWFDLKMYSSGGMITPSPQKYKDSLESGYSVGAIIAHGSPDLFQIGGNVESSLFNTMDNPGRLHFSTHVCCNTGEWDRGSTNGDCIAENAAFHAPNGTIGVLHNDKSGWVACAELLNFAQMFGFYGYNTPRRPTMAEINSYGKDFWVYTFMDSWKFRMEAQERNLFGAPAVPVWTGQPFSAMVTAPGAINIGANIPVPITVTDGSDAPIESTMVCLVKGTETFARGWTDASGEVTLYVSPLSPGFMGLTVSSGKHLPHVDSIPVMSSGRYVAYIHHFVTDSAPEGNGDGIINPGEEIRVHTWVKNYGNETATGVTGQLRIHEAGVTVTDPDVSFGDVPAEDSVLSQTGFGVQFDPMLPDNFQVRCSVVCKDDLDSTWISYLTLNSYSASLYYMDVTIKDSMAVWPNGRLDPTEQVELEVSVANQGMGNSFEARGVLRALDSLSVVTDTHALFGTVLSGSTVVCTDRFGITAHPHLPPESQLQFELDIIWDHGNDTTVQFQLFSGGMVATDPIPDGPRTPPLYFAYDDDDVFYSEAPVYDWVEIRDDGTELELADQETKPLALPDAFGPFVFYGESFDTISVCSNGWIAPGVTNDRSWQNRPLPTARNRAVIAPLWDDLLPPYGGGVLYWHDVDNNRFIVEWDSVHYSWAREDWDCFQVIFYDTTMAAEDGNTVILYQYKTANNHMSASIGMQPYWTAPDTIGIGCLFNNTYHRGASMIIPGSAIKLTTDPPELLGVAEEVTPASLLRGRQMVVAPNPFNANALVHWNLERDADVSLQVFDASGRVVRTLATGRRAAGTYTTTWNGKDDTGRELAHGIYFVRLQTPSEMVKTKTILAR